MLVIRRFAAWILDTLLSVVLPGLFIIFLLLRPVVSESIGRHSPGEKPDPRDLWGMMELGEKATIFVIFMLSAWFLPSLYFAFFESSAWRATPGKRALGLTVTRITGERISWLRAQARFWARTLCGII